MISNYNFFDISILRQVPEIRQFHQFSFTSQQPMLNSQQPSAWSSTSKCAQDWHSGLSPPSPILMSLPKNEKTFMYAIVVEIIVSINTINYQTILSLNTFTDEWFYCSILSPHKKPHNEKNSSFSGNIHVKAELLDQHGSKIQENGLTLTL